MIKNMNRAQALLFKTIITFLQIFIIGANSAAAQNIEKSSIEDWASLPEGLHKSIQSAFESPTKKSTLTIRKFEVIEKKLLKDQVNDWIKDYNSYGFNVKTQRPLKLTSGAKGFFIEAFHKDFNKSFAQFVSINNGRMSTLTCKSSEPSELKECKEALMTFSWP